MKKGNWEIVGLIACLLGVLYIGTYFIPQPWQENYDRALAALGHCDAGHRAVDRDYQAAKTPEEKWDAVNEKASISEWMSCKVLAYFRLAKEEKALIKEIKKQQEDYNQKYN